MSDIRELVQAGIQRVADAAAGPFIGPRSELTSQVPGPRGGADSIVSWTRNIGNKPYSFERITMRNGEVRFSVSRYNGYVGGTAWGCAWDRAHFITIPDGDMVKIFGRPFGRGIARAMGGIDPATNELY